MRLALLALSATCIVGGAAGTAEPKFEELQDVVGHYAHRSCVRVSAAKGAQSKRGTIRDHAACDMFQERLEHMVAVSGNDAMIQLHKPKQRGRHRPREYYAGVVATASQGVHLQQLLKIVRKGSEWLLAHATTPAPEQVSDLLQPQIGQWLINVASGADPRVTSKEMRDEDPEDPL
ncbi:hypothetical protein DIPPA_32751 [Diplonema papillatum]|nr:hypothetical protein DIPPA_32751 [Diplonema papillatum]